MFIVLISIGVGTASALITITLAGNVIITDDLLVEGQTDVMGPIIQKFPVFLHINKTPAYFFIYLNKFKNLFFNTV